MDIAGLIIEFGFETVALVGLGYFVFYVWQFVSNELEPKLEEMHFGLIRLIDQVRMLDQDMIRLQQKVNVVLEYKARQQVLEEAKQKEALRKQEEQE